MDELSLNGRIFHDLLHDLISLLSDGFVFVLNAKMRQGKGIEVEPIDLGALAVEVKFDAGDFI